MTQNVPNPVVDCMSDLLLWMCFSERWSALKDGDSKQAERPPRAGNSEALLCMTDSEDPPTDRDRQATGRKERRSLGNARSVDPLAGGISSMARITLEIDHQVRRLGRVGLKAQLSFIDPTGEIHHDAPPPVVLLRLDGFHDIEALPVEEEGVSTE
jgi:hypothetical protein